MKHYKTRLKCKTRRTQNLKQRTKRSDTTALVDLKKSYLHTYSRRFRFDTTPWLTGARNQVTYLLTVAAFALVDRGKKPSYLLTVAAFALLPRPG